MREIDESSGILLRSIANSYGWKRDGKAPLMFKKLPASRRAEPEDRNAELVMGLIHMWSSPQIIIRAHSIMLSGKFDPPTRLQTPPEIRTATGDEVADRVLDGLVNGYLSREWFMWPYFVGGR